MCNFSRQSWARSEGASADWSMEGASSKVGQRCDNPALGNTLTFQGKKDCVNNGWIFLMCWGRQRPIFRFEMHKITTWICLWHQDFWAVRVDFWHITWDYQRIVSPKTQTINTLSIISPQASTFPLCSGGFTEGKKEFSRPQRQFRCSK